MKKPLLQGRPCERCSDGTWPVARVTLWMLHLEVSFFSGTPELMVYFMKKPIYKWMMTGGTP
jgi:hypothetical protein